jgi:hypothetical protein
LKRPKYGQAFEGLKKNSICFSSLYEGKFNGRCGHGDPLLRVLWPWLLVDDEW